MLECGGSDGAGNQQAFTNTLGFVWVVITVQVQIFNQPKCIGGPDLLTFWVKCEDWSSGLLVDCLCVFVLCFCSELIMVIRPSWDLECGEMIQGLRAELHCCWIQKDLLVCMLSWWRQEVWVMCELAAFSPSYHHFPLVLSSPLSFFLLLWFHHFLSFALAWLMTAHSHHSSHQAVSLAFILHPSPHLLPKLSFPLLCLGTLLAFFTFFFLPSSLWLHPSPLLTSVCCMDVI